MSDSPPALTADSQVARIFEWRRGFNTIHLIDLGIELGLFKALADAPGSSAEALAAQLSLHPPYVRTWLWTAHGLTLVDSDDAGGFRLAPYMDQILASPTHPRYLGGYVQLGTQVAADDFARCVDAFRTGHVAPFQGRGERFARLIAQSTWGLQIATARKLLPGLPGAQAALEAGGTVLEVGCGTANFLVQVAKAFPNARAVGVDIDEDSLAVARGRVAEAGFGERITLVAGDIAQVVPAGSVDAAVMIEVLHEIAPAIRPAVVQAAAGALKPGGWMLIVDETYPTTLAESRLPEFRFPLQTGIEELTWGNVLPTREEQERLLRDAGFAGDIQRSLIGEGFTVLAAQR
jgi:SAM-dependent methyltransferase